MADKRKSFGARRLAFGGRSIPAACLLAASLILAAVPSALRAEEAGLKNGAASLAAGKYDAAVRQLSATVNSSSASPSNAAKALYLRGIAYRKLGESARAVADLGAAIWLGLPQDDRVKALVNRGLAYRAAGLSKEGEAELAAARKLGGSRTVDDLVAEGGGAPEGAAAIAAFATEVRPGDDDASSASRPRSKSVTSFRTAATGDQAPPPSSEPPPPRTADASPGTWSTSVDNGSQPSSSSGGNRLTRWFGSLTDSSSESTAPAPQPAPAQTAKPPKPSAPPAAASSSSWSTSTETQEASSAGAGETQSRWSRLFGSRTANADVAAQPAPSTPAGRGYRLQLATSRSEAEAKALWKQVSQAQSLDGVSPEIERVDIGNFGTFYSLRIGPFPDKAESLKVCNALKRSGIDCSPATQ